jgi:endogenous inhibitor of DNA gyrase (YacG/DUF329 family)
MPSGGVCAICGRRLPSAAAAPPATFPFCSSRCRDRDLGQWLAGAYAVAGSDEHGDELAELDELMTLTHAEHRRLQSSGLLDRPRP